MAGMRVLASLMLLLLQLPCTCGNPAPKKLEYFSMPSDGGEPAPRVVKVTHDRGHEIIWVAYDVPATNTQGYLTRMKRSRDEGRTWHLDPRYHESSFLNSSTDSVVYKATRHDLLARSVDHGLDWTDCQFNVNALSASQFAEKTAGKQGASLHFGFAAASPQNPSTIYGTFSVWSRQAANPTGGQHPRDLPGMYVSHDSGDHWTLFALQLRGNSPDESRVLGIDPSDPRRMIGHGQSGLVMTFDGGNNWSPVGEQAELEAPADLKGRRQVLAKWIAENKGAPIAPPPVHPPFTYLAVWKIQFQPGNSNIIYLVTNKGLYKSTDSARTWCLIYAGKPSVFEVGSLYVDPENPDHLFVGTRDQVVVSHDAGCHFRTLFQYH